MLALGMTLEEIVATVTSNPAIWCGCRTNRALKVGREADVSVLEILQWQFKLSK